MKQERFHLTGNDIHDYRPAPPRPSTSAMEALEDWQSAVEGRSYKEIQDNDDTYIVDVSWHDDDDNAKKELSCILGSYRLKELS